LRELYERSRKELRKRKNREKKEERRVRLKVRKSDVWLTQK
jgi:hypothetical protein